MFKRSFTLWIGRPRLNELKIPPIASATGCIGDHHVHIADDLVKNPLRSDESRRPIDVKRKNWDLGETSGERVSGKAYLLEEEPHQAINQLPRKECIAYHHGLSGQSLLKRYWKAYQRVVRTQASLFSW
jgi:hypothetical protein